MFEETKLMTEPVSKSIAHVIFEQIENLPPLRAKEELMQVKAMYEAMLKERLEESAKQLEHNQIQLKEFQS